MLTEGVVPNAKGAIFFPANQEHRDQKASGISYEDNYKGNALAAMIAPGKIEIRYHGAFTDQVVANMVRSLLARPELAFLKGWQATYQGRPLALPEPFLNWYSPNESQGSSRNLTTGNNRTARPKVTP